MALISEGIVGGIRVADEIGSGVNVDGMGDDVTVGEVRLEVTVGAHPLINVVKNTSARNSDAIDFFMLLSLLISLCKTTPNGMACEAHPKGAPVPRCWRRT